MRKIAIFSLIAVLVLFSISAFAATSFSNSKDVIDFVKSTAKEAIGKNDKVTNVTLSNKILLIELEIKKPSNLSSSLEDIADNRTASITDDLLEYMDLDSYWDEITISVKDVGHITFTKSDIINSKYGRYFDYGTWNTTQGESKALKESFNGYGKMISILDRGDGVCIMKYKIAPSWNNELTINQNYHTVCNFVTDGEGARFDEIQYWAVADMTSGKEAKVISFTMDAALIQKIKDEKVFATSLEKYVDDLWIHPSLLR